MTETNIELEHCGKCNQMTNHRDGQCLKCLKNILTDEEHNEIEKEAFAIDEIIEFSAQKGFILGERGKKVACDKSYMEGAQAERKRILEKVREWLKQPNEFGSAGWEMALRSVEKLLEGD